MERIPRNWGEQTTGWPETLGEICISIFLGVGKRTVKILFLDMGNLQIFWHIDATATWSYEGRQMPVFSSMFFLRFFIMHL